MANATIVTTDWVHLRSSIRKTLRRLSPDTQLADIDDLTQEACCYAADYLDDGETEIGAIWRACRAALVTDEDGQRVYSLARVPSVHMVWESCVDHTRSPSGAGNYSRAAAAGRAIHPVAPDSPVDSPADDWESLQAVCLPDVFAILSDRT